MDPALVDLLEKGGVIAALLFFIVGGLRGWWVFGRHHEEVVKQAAERLEEMTSDRDYWRSTTVQSLRTASESVQLAERRQGPPAPPTGPST